MLTRYTVSHMGHIKFLFVLSPNIGDFGKKLIGTFCKKFAIKRAFKIKPCLKQVTVYEVHIGYFVK